jgi:hypothetical protein
MLCLQSPIALVNVLATSRGLYRHCFWHWDIVIPHFSSRPEAASWELIPLTCACDHLWGAYDRSYSPHPPRGRGYHTELVPLMCACDHPSAKLHALHGSVVPTGVTVLLGLCNPPRWGRGELPKSGLLYPLVWFIAVIQLVRYQGHEVE